MSFSKLDSSGATSSQQHALLLPTVLDTVFPYLTFSDLKSSRLVCKIWSEVGIPFIGRRNLKPVSFSNITQSDFLALRNEIIKFPSKIKFFQGFRLQWDEINAIINSNFLTSFIPSQLVIYRGNVADSSNQLASLIQPVLATLTDLDLEINWDSDSVSALSNLAHLAITLKRLRIQLLDEDKGLTHRQVHAIYRALEGAFESQSSNLEALKLELKCEVSIHEKDGFRFEEIQFPVFPRLESLSLTLEMYKPNCSEDYWFILAPFDFCIKFPQLVHLKIWDGTLFTIESTAIRLTRGHSLKKLHIWHEGFSEEDCLNTCRRLYSSFPFIEEYKDTRIRALPNGGIEIPWVDTLKILEIQSICQNFNFGHLTKLEDLHYTVSEYGDPNFPIPSIIQVLLENYHQLSHLRRFHLTYTDVMYMPLLEKKNQIQEGIPEEFRAILAIDSISTCLPYNIY